MDNASEAEPRQHSSPNVGPLVEKKASQLQFQQLNEIDGVDNKNLVGLKREGKPFASCKKEECKSELKWEFEKTESSSCLVPENDAIDSEAVDSAMNIDREEDIKLPWAKEEEKCAVKLEALDSAISVHNGMEIDGPCQGRDSAASNPSFQHDTPERDIVSATPGPEQSPVDDLDQSSPQTLDSDISQDRERSLSRADEQPDSQDLQCPVSDDIRPTKRRRMAAVVVPTIRSILAREERQAQSVEYGLNDKDWEKVKNMKNANVKSKLESIADVFLASRLKGFEIYEVPLPHHDREVDSTRLFLSSTFGGSPQDTFPGIGKAKLKTHGNRMDDFMYPSMKYNPNAPSLPGAPGLFFSFASASEDQCRKPLRVITGIEPNKWCYVGQYELRPDKSLSIKEWTSQPLRVRKAWVTKLAKKWGPELRARISLRKRLGHEPTVEQVKKEVPKNIQVTKEEIMKAFDSGQETILVYTMRCVDYDIAFQTKIIEKLKTWVPPPPKAEGEKATGRGKSKKKTTLGKRKAQELEDEEGDGADDEEYEEDDWEVELDAEPEWAYRSKGTRSRPINVE